MGNFLSWLKISWEDSPRLSYDPEQEKFQIDKSYLRGSGLDKEFRSEPEILYCRPEFHTQFAFLHDIVTREGEIGWILGSPGTGKSCTAFAFLLTLDRRRYDATWIHLPFAGDCDCFQIVDGRQRSFVIERGSMSSLHRLLTNIDSAQRIHIVFLDGLIHDMEWHFSVYGVCAQWIYRNPDCRPNRRLVGIGSSGARCRSSQSQDTILQWAIYKAFSWSEEEFCVAVKDDEMFALVAKYLDAGLDTDALMVIAKDNSNPDKLQARYDLIKSKYYFAGSCARNMFSNPTVKVIEAYENAVEMLPDKLAAAEGIVGLQSDCLLNRLFATFASTASSRSCTQTLVSPFVATEIASKMGAALSGKLADVLQDDLSPALDGWLRELYFFAKLRNSGVTLRTNYDTVHWPESAVATFDPLSCIFQSSSKGSFWYKPTKWNQGGYDAVFVDHDRKLVRFVIITGGNDHSLKLRYFRQLATRLRTQISIRTVEICVVIPEKNLSSFVIPQSKIIDVGALVEFGWPKNSELKLVKMLGMDYTWPRKGRKRPHLGSPSEVESTKPKK